MYVLVHTLNCSLATILHVHERHHICVYVYYIRQLHKYTFKTKYYLFSKG